ncbi:hypothetical protein Avbf_03715 [Armadillidium vulgare]|nr:hypothetical protein Avbf_03715 [Armadillidium vulgare]
MEIGRYNNPIQPKEIRVNRKREKHRSKSSSLIPCPLVLQNISNQLQELKKNCTESEWIKLLLKNIASKPYWDRCICSREDPPQISEDVLPILLRLTPPYRFNVVFITDSKKESLVIGTESLLKSVYRLLQLPQLKPCLQRPSEHSVSILKIDIAHCKEEVWAKRPTNLPEIIKINLRFVISFIFQKEQLLYIGCPLNDYGITSKKFLRSLFVIIDFGFNMITLEEKN